MDTTVSKSRFKAHALEYFRQVQSTGKPLVITDRGTPVLQLIPYSEDATAGLRVLRDTVLKYRAPLKPVAEEDWESAQ